MQSLSPSHTASSATPPSEEIPMSERQANSAGPEKAERKGIISTWSIWRCISVLGLGFPAKYRERLYLFEDLVPQSDIPWSTAPEYSDRGAKGKGTQRTMREKQQEEWDRLNIAVSVITATSAAALAIQATNSAKEYYWLVTAFYSIAFGLSLQGIILITYLTIVAGGSSDEAIGRLAKGTLLSNDNPVSVWPTAFTMAFPAILATYSSIALLVGLVAMVVAPSGAGIEARSTQYILVTMIPVGLSFVFLCVAVLLGEAGTWIETQGRKKYLNEHGEYRKVSGRKFPELEETLASLTEGQMIFIIANSKGWKSFDATPALH